MHNSFFNRIPVTPSFTALSKNQGCTFRSVPHIRCYEANIPLGVDLLSADSPPF